MLSSGDGVHGFFIVSCKGTAPLINNPLYECAELFQRCLNEGMIAVALKSKAEIGSQEYLVLSGDVFVSDVLAKSDDIVLPRSAPKPDNNPPSAKPIAASADVPIASPLAAPAEISSSLTMFF